MTAPLLPQVRLLRAMLEAMQPEVRRLTNDIQGAAQVSRVNGRGTDANTLAITAGEATEAHRAIADAIGCLDDTLTGLETVALSEAHPDATDEEFEALLAGIGR